MVEPKPYNISDKRKNHPGRKHTPLYLPSSSRPGGLIHTLCGRESGRWEQQGVQVCSCPSFQYFFPDRLGCSIVAFCSDYRPETIPVFHKLPILARIGSSLKGQKWLICGGHSRQETKDERELGNLLFSSTHRARWASHTTTYSYGRGDTSA